MYVQHLSGQMELLVMGHDLLLETEVLCTLLNLSGETDDYKVYTSGDGKRILFVW